MFEGYNAKARLTYVAVQLFIRNGFNATSLHDICTMTGVSKGAFFHHFENKDEAALAGLEDSWTLIEERLAEARVASLVEPEDRLTAYLDWLAESLKDPECPLRLLGLLARETGLTHAGFRAACERAYESWERQILRLLGQEDSSAKELARQIICAAEGALTLAAARGDANIIAQQLGGLKERYKKSTGQ